MVYKIKSKDIYDFMRIFSAVAGVILGIGFLFIGVVRPNFIIILLGLICVVTGSISALTFVREEDEYEIICKTPEEPVRPTA